MSKYILLEEDDELFDFKLTAIQSNIYEEYRFVYLFNEVFHTKFQRIEDQILLYKKQAYSFAVFQYEDVYNHLNYVLFSNISFAQETKNENLLTLFDVIEEKYYLLPQYKQFNYLLKIEGESLYENSLHLQQHLFINLIYSISINTLKNKGNLIIK